MSCDKEQVFNLPKDNVFAASQVRQGDVVHARRALVSCKDSMVEFAGVIKKIERTLTGLESTARDLGAYASTPFTQRPRAAQGLAHIVMTAGRDIEQLKQFLAEARADLDDAGQRLSRPAPQAGDDCWQ